MATVLVPCKGCDDPKRCTTLDACVSTQIETALSQADGCNCSTVGGCCDVCVPRLAPVEDYSGKVDGKGSKVALDGSKLRVELVPPQTIEGIAAVLSYGAKKYAANNWMRGISYMAIIAGVLRHIFAFLRGQEFDKDTGLPELYHAMCGLTFLAYYHHGPTAGQYKAFDDRPFKELK